MKDGFLKIACATPDLRVGDCVHNTDRILELISQAHTQGVKIICFPELSITGYTCGDLFLQESLGRAAEQQLIRIAKETRDMDIVSIVGLPFVNQNKIYNCAAVICKGALLGIVPKTNLPNYSAHNELRYFTQGFDSEYFLKIQGEEVPFGTGLVFCCETMPELTFGVELCEDLYTADSPSVRYAKAGATLIFNLSASPAAAGKAEYRKMMVQAKSASLCCAYALADAGIGESTTDLVFSGHNLVAENGKLLAESEPFKNQMLITEVDLQKLCADRRKCNTFTTDEDIFHVDFSLAMEETALTRPIPKNPFVPEESDTRTARCKEILQMQAVGLMRRMQAIGCKNVVLGLSGGLDSTLALIVAAHTFDMLGLDRSGIHTITMPCFGTTGRTYRNACELAQKYGSTLREIRIEESVRLHFRDIGHDESVHNAAYENAQARERTQILMDIANDVNGLVVGTGDLSELALGWATYNGDHMSNYGVNGSIPKTLVRHLVRYEAEHSEQELSAILLDILDTPVSPELLPPDQQGKIAQKTEDLVGPYELHDFFLYYVIRHGFTPAKIFRMANYAFAGEYEDAVIFKWLKTFYRRFFTQQFKRSCLPDGVGVGSVGLSPRTGFRMPSDASMNVWMQELDALEQMLVK
ncbi:MAG: NAD(+) synthase [Oscillospiraceae bacterium]|nr:NAD(+) synthase [Oscillospiraceae bacterium]